MIAGFAHFVYRDRIHAADKSVKGLSIDFHGYNCGTGSSIFRATPARSAPCRIVLHFAIFDMNLLTDGDRIGSQLRKQENPSAKPSPSGLPEYQ